MIKVIKVIDASDETWTDQLRVIFNELFKDQGSNPCVDCNETDPEWCDNCQISYQYELENPEF